MPQSIEEMMELSDEEFLKMNSNGEIGGGETPSDDPVDEDDTVQESTASGEEAADGAPGSDLSGSENADAGTQEPELLSSEGKKEDPAAGDTNAGGTKKPQEGSESGTEAQAEPAVTEAQEPDYKALYEQITAPFKANGKEFKVHTPEEVIRLMQQGAGAGKKMAQLAPNLRILKTLEQHGLMNENELSFLIDIKNKNPEAIKKLIKDANIDPLDINTDEPANYTPVNHTVPQEQVVFGETLSFIAENFEKGRETISMVNQTWDSESKEEIWKDPQILKDIASQRENGVYDLITSRMERMQILGDIPGGTPFLRAYTMAGNALMQEQRPTNGQQPQMTQPLTAANTQQPGQPRVLDQRAAAPKPKVSNQDKMAAVAAPLKSKPTKPRQTVENIFNLSDEEFMRTFHGRL